MRLAVSPESAGTAGAVAPSVSVVIPTYRDMALVQRSLPRLLESQGVRLEVVIVNNDPDQQVAQWVAAQGYPSVRVLDVGFNAGFMGAINRGIGATSGEFVLFHNADLEISNTYLQTLAAFFAEHPRAGAASGKLLRYDLATHQGTEVFDTAGIAIRRSRGAFDRGEGQHDQGQFDEPDQVFAVSGAALFARREALDDVRCRGQYLDESLFMYKDDIDLGWRLRLRGWECWYVPSALAYHARTSRGLGGVSYLRSPLAYLRNERKKPATIRLHSMKNQWVVLAKNEDWRGLLHDGPWIVAREAAVFAANLVASPRLAARALLGFARVLPETVKNRRSVQRRRTVPSSRVRAWMK